MKEITKDFFKQADKDDILEIFENFIMYEDINIDINFLVEQFINQAINIIEKNDAEYSTQYLKLGNRFLDRIIGYYDPEEHEYFDGIEDFEIDNLSDEKLHKLLEYGIFDKTKLYSILSQNLQNNYFSEFISTDNNNNNNNNKYIWKCTKEQTISKFDILCEKVPDADYNLLQLTNIDNKELVRYIFNKEIQSQNNDFFDLYYKSKKTNPYIHIPEELIDEKFDFLNVEQYLRLSTSDDFFIKKIFKLLSLPYGIDFLKYLIENSKDYVSAIGKIVNSIEEYQAFFEDKELTTRLLDDSEKEKILSKLCRIMLGNSKNTFAIYSAEDLDDYENLRNYEINRILKKFTKSNNNVSEQEGQFAILEGLYGISRDEAEKLVNRYGVYIDDIQTDENIILDDIKNYIHALKNILSLNKNDIAFLSRDNDFMKLLNAPGDFSLGMVTDIEKNLRDMYSHEFEKKMFKLKQDEKPIYEIEYNGKNINVYEIPRKNEHGEYEQIDFGLFARVEGAYISEYETPDNYLDMLSNIDMSYHGNCESYVDQSMNSTARFNENSVLFFYNTCNEILLSAPWDIISLKANSQFDTTNSTDLDLCYTLPDRFVDTTRHLHNEIVSERYSINKEDNTVKRRLPNFVGIDKEKIDLDISILINAENCEEQLRAATDLNIPILVINREALAIQEKNRIKRDLELLENYDLDSSNTNKSFEQLIKDIITRFENNSVGLRFHDSKKGRFDNSERTKLIKQVMNIIKKSNEMDRYDRVYMLMNVLNDEISKQDSIIGRNVSNDEHFDFYSNIISQLERDYPRKKMPAPNRILSVKADSLNMKQIHRRRQEDELKRLQQEDEKMDEMIVMSKKIIDFKQEKNLNSSIAPNIDNNDSPNL